MKVVPMTEAHVRALDPQAAQSELTPDERIREAALLQQYGSAYAVVDGDAVLCIAGVQQQWGGRGVAWCLLSRHAGRRMVVLARLMRRYMDALDYGRLEMYVDAQFRAGCRLAELLGFRNETPDGMRRFLPNGNDAFMYGRVR